MGRSQETFGKKEREKKRDKKRQDKLAKKAIRKSNPKTPGSNFSISYVDEYGNPTDTPPDHASRPKIKLEDIVIAVPRMTEEEAAADNVRQGKVAFFNSDKGYGFIREDSTGEKYFVHVSQLAESVEESNSVTFELERGPKGLNAINVKKVKPPTAEA